jgi:hypothetical protein
VTVAASVARLTCAADTPGTLPSAFSTRLTHEAQVMPVMSSVQVVRSEVIVFIASLLLRGIAC